MVVLVGGPFFLATSGVVSDSPVSGNESHLVSRSHTANRPTFFHSDANKTQNLNLNMFLNPKLYTSNGNTTRMPTNRRGNSPYDHRKLKEK